MTFQLFKRPQKTANLVFTDEVIRFVELVSGSKYEILRAMERKIGPDKIKDGKIIDFETLRLILEECVEEWGLKKRKVRFIVPDSHIVIRQIDVPIDVREDEMQGYLFLEMGTTIHLPFDEPIFDSVLLGQSGKKQNVLLVAAPEDVVNSFQRLLSEVKLQPVIADISPLSLYRLCHFAQYSNHNDHIMILNFDENLLTISIFHQDIPIFMRPVKLVGEIDQELAVADEEGITDILFQLEDAFREIEKVMNFYTYTLNQGNAAVNRIFISGDHSDLFAIQSHLSARLQNRIESLITEEITSKDGKSAPPAFSTALGLALKEVAH